MSFKKICLILIIIGIFIIPTCYATINSGLEAPDEFEKAEIWDTAAFDIYDLKGDEYTSLFICNYTQEDYDLLFKNSNFYTVAPIGNNMFAGVDNTVGDGYLLEIVEHDGKNYIVYIQIGNSPNDEQVKNCEKYLTEFNKINNVKPITAV